MKRFVLLLAFMLLGSGFSFCAAEETAQVFYSKTSLGIRAWGCGVADVPVQVITGDPARAEMAEKDIAGEIRFFPFDSSAGIYAAGDGEPAGERAVILSVAEDRSLYTVRLREPGKYLLSGAEFYLLDLREPALSALRAELDETLEKNRDKTEKQTARKLHDWLCGRVKSVFPEEAEGMRTACADPMNALLTGYADRRAYARLYNILLEAAGIRSIIAEGTAGEETAEWNLSKLDGTWLWTDPAMDDVRDKKQNRYLEKGDRDFAKDHTLSAADEALLAERIRIVPVDVLLEGKLPFEMAEPEQNSDDIFELVWYDGPMFAVGDTATVTWHVAGNRLSSFGFETVAEGYAANMVYSPFVDEYLVYGDEFLPGYFEPGAVNVPKTPTQEELLTVDWVSEDSGTFTVTFRKPGKYALYNELPFYLISPEQTELVAMTEEIAAEAEKAKSATERETAQKLMKWMNGRIRYNYDAYRYTENVTPRDMGSASDGLTGLLYGKTTCGGYAQAYQILLKEAGIMDFLVSGDTKSGGHTYDLNRLDGVWSYTDPTWADGKGMVYFAQPPEKMNRDHMPYQNVSLDMLYFGDLYCFQRAQAEMALKNRVELPQALKYLPDSAEGYGFPEEVPEFVRVTGLTESGEEGVVLTLDKPVPKVRIVQMRPSGSENTMKEYVSNEAGDRFATAKTTLAEPVRVEILSVETLKDLKKPAIQEILDYENGEEIRASYRYLEPMKKNEIPGYTEKSCRVFAYDSGMKPAMAGWTLVGGDGIVVLNVYFDAEGQAERYEAALQTGTGSVRKSWSAAADGTLINLDERKIEDPESVSVYDWDQVFFE